MEKKVSDEIDLYDLLVRIIQLFKTNIRLFGSLVLVGLMVSLVYYYSVPKVFEGRMMVFSHFLTGPFCSKVTEGLDQMAVRQDWGNLAKQLNLSDRDAAQVSRIKVETVKERKDSIFVVMVEVTDVQILPRLTEGILSFFRENEFIRVRVRQRESLYRSMIQRIGREIKSLDSLQNKLGKGRSGAAAGSEMLIFDPGNIYSRIVELTKARITYENALELADGIQLVAGFNAVEKASALRLPIILFLGFLGGIFCSLFYLSVRWIIRVAKM